MSSEPKGWFLLKINDSLRISHSNKVNKKPAKKEERPLVPEEKVDIGKGEDNFLLSMARLKEQSELAGQSKIKTDTFKSGFVTDFVDAKQVDDKMLELAKLYPDMVQITTRDYMTSGYDGKVKSLRGPAPLRYMRIGKKDEDKSNKPGVLLAAAPHAREVMQPMIMLETVQQLLTNYDPDSDDPACQEITKLMDSVDVYIVPVSNPDGLNFAMHDDPMWRKTRSKVPGSDEIGVDCNRNYDHKWEKRDPSRHTYGGHAPFSEPETRNVKSIVEEHPNIKFVNDYHSAGNQVRRPLNVTDEKDLKYFKEIQQRLHDSIKSSRGKEYDMIESKVVNGSSDDYFYFEKGIFAFVIEDGLLT